jgi:hypothetical protein
MTKRTTLSSNSMTAELNAASREFDRPDLEPRFRKAPVSEQRHHDAALRRARRKSRGPAMNGGAKRIQITVDGDLLARADIVAQREHITRSELIARGLRLALAS